MKRKRCTDEPIGFVPKQAESDLSIEEICRRMGIGPVVGVPLLGGLHHHRPDKRNERQEMQPE